MTLDANEAERATVSPRCSGCGYDLAGLEEGGMCPECGSTQRTRREWGRESWLPALALALGGIGTVCLFCFWPFALVLGLLSIAIASLAFVVTRPRLGGRSRDQATASIVLGSFVAFAAGMLTLAVLLAGL